MRLYAPLDDAISVYLQTFGSSQVPWLYSSLTRLEIDAAWSVHKYVGYWCPQNGPRPNKVATLHYQIPSA